MKIIIVGAGEVGFHIARHLATEKKDVVVIDSNPSAISRVTGAIDVQAIKGSGSSPIVLEQAGIKDAEILLAVANSDETNLVACLVADNISPATKKLARIRDADFETYQERFRENTPHIDTIINPEVEVVKTIDRLMSAPGALEVGEFAGGIVKFVGIRLDKGSGVAKTPLSKLAEKTGRKLPLIAAVVSGERLIIPDGDHQLTEGDLIYFICESDKLLETLSVFNKKAEPMRHVLIIGGGRIGMRLASLLEKKSISTKLIERDPERCARLSEQLDKVTILHGDGSDQSLLKEENIQNMDMVVAVTNDDETNILTSLLVRQMGAGKTITRVSKSSYFQVMPTIGLEQVVSPRLSAVNAILKHIRRGKVTSAITFRGEQAEILEAIALETSDIVGTPLKKISLPKGALVIGIVRADDIIIPSGKSVIEPGDRIILFATKNAVPKIEKILSVKLEYF